jgi:bacterioferritin-associated ferredoxin
VYVCVCNAYRESLVLDAIKKTASTNAATVEQVYARLGSRPRCGRCLNHVKNLIDVNQQKQAEVRS